MKLKCNFMENDDNGHHKGGLCMALNTMRPCIIFDTNGIQIKICEHLEII